MCNISDKYLADFKELEQAAILKIKKYIKRILKYEIKIN